MKKQYVAPALVCEEYELNTTVFTASYDFSPKNSGVLHNHNCWGPKTDLWEINENGDMCY